MSLIAPRKPGAASVAAALACAAALIAGCSSSSAPSSGSTPTPAPTGATASTSAPATSNTITIKNFAFSPSDMTVAPGTKITVVNQDSVTHTVTATGNKAFDTGDIPAGGTTTFTAPSTAGAYPFICSIHTYMAGTLTVS